MARKTRTIRTRFSHEAQQTAAGRFAQQRLQEALNAGAKVLSEEEWAQTVQQRAAHAFRPIEPTLASRIYCEEDEAWRMAS